MSLTRPAHRHRSPRVVVRPLAGVSMCTCGGVVSSVTCTLAVVAVPFGVGRHRRQRVGAFQQRHRAVNVPPLTLAGTPLITTAARCVAHRPGTRIGLTFTNARFAGCVIVIVVDAPLTVTSTGADSTRVNFP